MDFRKSYKEELNSIKASDDFKTEVKKCMLDEIKSNNRRHYIAFKYVTGSMLLFLLISFAGINIHNKFLTKTQDEDEDLVGTVLTFNNAYYEKFPKNRKDLLKRYALPEKISKDDIGELIGVINEEDIGEKEYVGANIYEYKPIDSLAIIIVDFNGDYEYFVFCNFLKGMARDDIRTDTKQNLELYNIKSSQDITQIDVIYEKEKHFKGYVPIVTNTISDPIDIQRFYDEYKEMKDIGREYYADINEGVTEEMWQNGYDEYLKGSCTFRVKLKNGLFFDIGYYPVTKHFEDTLSHYRLTDEFVEFLNVYSQ